METLISIKPFLAIITASLAVILVVASRKSPNIREFWSFLAGVVTFLIVASMIPSVLSGVNLEYTVFQVLPGIELKFRADPLGLFFAVTASFLWIITTAYSIGYMRSEKEHAQPRYYACFAIAVASAIGVAFSANLFTLYLFYEILSISTYPLVAHHEDKAAWEGARKYTVYLVGLSKTFLLAGVVMTYMITGTLDFQVGGIFTTDMPSMLVTATYIFILIGLAKAGMMPFHNWLPS
ncbi:MAG: monovalent cation/H+ antiporter subunit D family protein, partial [Deltaproteobacteria bacterium]|nr:monovalent cation/H+ antiporter subunit D family protein [Deltaproteobacteria bacterium]